MSAIINLRKRLREHFLMPHATLDANLSVAEREERHRARDLGRQKQRAARILVDASLHCEAIPLYQNAVILLARAHLAPFADDPTASVAEPLSPEDDLRKLIEKLKNALVDEAAKTAMLRGADATAIATNLDRLPRFELVARCQDLDELVTWLLGRIQPRTPVEIRGLRSFRVGVVLATLLILPFLVYSWNNFPRNVSRGKKVTISSVGNSVPVSQVVDGIITNYPPLQTKLEVGPWAVVDLGAQYVVTDIWVYGHPLCCHEESVPMVAEVSNDGTKFEFVGRQDAPLDELSIWRIKSIKGTVRYLRIRGEGKKKLLFREISVFGRRAH